jgi:hypothetical protein
MYRSNWHQKRQQARHDRFFHRTSQDDEGHWHAPENTPAICDYSAIKVGGRPLHLQAAPPHAVDRRGMISPTELRMQSGPTGHSSTPRVNQ